MLTEVIYKMQRIIEDFGTEYFAAYTRSRELEKAGIRCELFPVTAETHWRLVWDKEVKTGGGVVL